MKFGKVMDLLAECGYPIESIQFKSPKMRAWYRPVEFSNTGQGLVCRNLETGGFFEWRWDIYGGISHQCEVLKVSVEPIKRYENKSLLGSDKLVTLHLSDR